MTSRATELRGPRWLSQVFSSEYEGHRVAVLASNDYLEVLFDGETLYRVSWRDWLLQWVLQENRGDFYMPTVLPNMSRIMAAFPPPEEDDQG